MPSLASFDFLGLQLHQALIEVVVEMTNLLLVELVLQDWLGIFSFRLLPKLEFGLF